MSNIDCPVGYHRTDPDDRELCPGNITVGHREAFESIDEELSRWGAGLDRIESAVAEYANDSRIPHKSADPDDPGVAVYFHRLDEHADQGYAIACDRWNLLRDNARTIALYVCWKRLAERCGIATAEAEFQTAALLSGDEDAVAAALPVHVVLGVDPDASPGDVRDAWRERVVEAHPHQGGSEEELQHVHDAKEVLLDAE